MAHGQFTHIEVPADDLERAKRFYSELFGWQLGDVEGMPDYPMFTFGKIESAGGALGTRGESIGDHLRVYLDVDSIDPVLGRVPGLGGVVKKRRTEIQGWGWFAVIDDSEGNELGLFEALPSD